MFVADKIILLRLPKTGSTHLANLLFYLIGGHAYPHQNRLTTAIPTEGKLIYGTIRDPWDWYVSLWSYGCRRQGAVYRGVVEQRLRKIGWKKNFPAALSTFLKEVRKPAKKWAACYEDPHDPALFRRWLHLMMDPARSCDLPERYGSYPLHSIAGLMTFRYLRLYLRDVSSLSKARTLADLNDLDKEHCLLDGIIRNENLERCLIDALTRAGYELTEAQLEVINAGKRSNVSHKRERSLSFYYDQECAGLVQEREAFIAEKFGYRSPV